MDSRHLNRLQEEQRKAILETEARIDQLKQFKEDYKALQERLRTLPDKVNHNVMVPFGKMAFMQGQLVHTNEILVLLGDNWFAERSAKQAIGIAGRRVEELDRRLKDLESQQKLLEPRLGFTSDLQAELEGQGNTKEIVEDYDEAKERLWDEQHRENVRKYRQEIRRNEDAHSHQEKIEVDEQKSDSSLWSRLDELERQEIQRGEIDRSMSSEDDEEISKRFHSKVGSDKSSPADRRVSWADTIKDEPNAVEKSDDDSDDDDDNDDDYTDEDEADNEDDNDEGEDATRTPVQRVITFKHSSTPGILPHQKPEGDISTIHSPGDIYRLVTPKSILKKTLGAGSHSLSERISELNSSELQNNQSSDTVSEGRSQTSQSNQISDTVSEGRSQTSQDEEQFWHPSSLQQFSSATSSASQAFTGFVVEKSSDFSTTAASSTPVVAAPTGTSHEQTKRVSKFKTSRLSNNAV